MCVACMLICVGRYDHLMESHNREASGILKNDTYSDHKTPTICLFLSFSVATTKYWQLYPSCQNTVRSLRPVIYSTTSPIGPIKSNIGNSLAWNPEALRYWHFIVTIDPITDTSVILSVNLPQFWVFKSLVWFLNVFLKDGLNTLLNIPLHMFWGTCNTLSLEPAFVLSKTVHPHPPHATHLHIIVCFCLFCFCFLLGYFLIAVPTPQCQSVLHPLEEPHRLQQSNLY